MLCRIERLNGRENDCFEMKTHLQHHAPVLQINEHYSHVTARFFIQSLLSGCTAAL